MTIRSRLLSLLLPALTALVGLIALFFYLNLSHEILNSFRTRLQSVVIATAQSIDPEEIKWISQHLQDSNLSQQPRYQAYRQKLVQLKQQLPIDNLYIVQIEPTESKSSIPEQKDTAYQQVFLLDASDPNSPPGDVDFSETDEQTIYFTKKALVTPIYESRKTGERFMSAYAPIMDEQGSVISLLGADVRMAEIDRKLQNAIFIIFTGALITMLLTIGTVFLIANKISRPVQQLNQAALSIAAGNYEANIQAEGPKEIVELANTFNTMSECLVENISRLRESSLVRERMYGEYECALLLQHYMLRKVVEDFHDPHLNIKLISVNFSNAQKGLLLRTDKDDATNTLQIALIEAPEAGFEALYNLNKNSIQPVDSLLDYSYVECQFQQNYSMLNYINKNLFSPLVWSIKSQQFIMGDHQTLFLNPQDMIFLYNSSLIEQFETEDQIKKWLGKVLRHFAEDGLEVIQTMLTNELSFLAKKENLTRNFQILSIQVKGF